MRPTPNGPAPATSPRTCTTASRRWQLTVADAASTAWTRIDAVLPELDDKAAVTRRHRRRPARAAVGAGDPQRSPPASSAHLQGEYWIGVLEEYGLLPNYTLLDDTVILDVGLSWTDPDTNTFQTEHAQFQRGSAQAIREFAPGATFYARGWEIAIDAVDLGLDGESIRPWVVLPRLRLRRRRRASTAAAERSRSCPRCGSTGIADTGQRLDVVELTHVVRRGPARRGGHLRPPRRAHSDRRFQLVTAADVDPAADRPALVRRRTSASAAPTCAPSTCAGSTSASPGTEQAADDQRRGALRSAVPGLSTAAASSTSRPGATAPTSTARGARYRTAADEHTVARSR